MQGFIDQVTVDWMMGGRGESSGLATNLSRSVNPGAVRFDPGLMRPWVDGDGQKYLDVLTGNVVFDEKTGREVAEKTVVPLQRLISNGLAPVTYNTAALPRLVWERIDRQALKASRQRLRAYADIAAANTYGGFDGMAVTAVSKDTMSDPGDAKVSMSLLDEGTTGLKQQFTPDIVPLPITHNGFYLDSRVLAVSRNSGVPLDTTQTETASRRVGEAIEKMTIGITDLSTFVIGSSTDFTNRGLYGLVTQPDRLTYTSLTAVAGDTVAGVKDDVLAMMATARSSFFFGPYVLYFNSSYDSLMDDDYWVYSTTGGAAPTKTLRQRLMDMPDIQDVRRLDFLGTTQRLILVQMTSDTVRAIDGMSPTTVMWEEQGGAKISFRVAAIQVPDFRSQYVGTTTTRACGIVVGTTS